MIFKDTKFQKILIMDKKASENTTVRNIYITVENLQAAQKL